MNKKRILKEVLKWNAIVLMSVIVLLTASFFFMSDQIKQEFLKIMKPRKIAVMVIGIVIGVSAIVTLSLRDQ